MINANELRIGNWLNVIKVSPVQITADHIKSIAEGDADYSAIPLTPDILQKAGFVQISDYDPEGPTHRMNSSIGVIDVSYGYSMVDVVQNIGRVRHNKIKYLHQLQNLYFALTGEELTINL